MKRANQKGAALILALILMVVLSVMAVSLLFLSRSETWASLNYRLMTQSRYGAEAGLDAAADYLVNTYVPPAAAGTDPIGAYTVTQTGVTIAGQPVTLVANPPNSNFNYGPATYPDPGVEAAFNQAVSKSFLAGNTQVNYGASATLLSLGQFVPYGKTTPVTIVTWRIQADAIINGVRNSQVEVTAILERQVSPTFNYAAFADGAGCGALTFGGGGTTDSYDSTTVMNGSVMTQAFGGNVGTNGNLSSLGSTTTINGNLYTPRTGVGSCTTSKVTAFTSTGGGSVNGSIVELPQNVTYDTPTIPPPGTTDLTLNNGDCGNIPGCSGGKGTYALAPGSYGNISLNGGATLTLTAGTYNINSIIENGQATILIDSTSGPVILNVTGNNQTNPINLTGGGVSNPSLDPSNFQMFYAGTAALMLKGGATASALLYAPNASYSFGGGGSWYGAVIGNTLTDMGGAAIHYDRRLRKKAYHIGNYTLDSFNWVKF